MKTTIKNNIKIIVLLVCAFSFKYSNAQYSILEADYNDKNEIVSLVPDKSWSRATDVQLPEILSKVYLLNNLPGLRLIAKTDERNLSVYRYQQTQFGYDVDGGEIIIFRINNEISSILGRLVSVPNVPLSIIMESEALKSALNFLGTERKYLWDDKEQESFLKDVKDDPKATYYPTGKLVYTRNILTLGNTYNLCYEFEINTASPERIFIYVNANNGKIEYHYNALQHVNGQGTALYHGNVNIKTARLNDTTYYLHDSTRKIYTYSYDNGTTTRYNFLSKNNNFSGNYQKAGVAAHYGVAIAYDYYKTKWGRNSYDGAGAKLVQRTHWDVNFDNAYWNGVCMTYGDGDGADNGPCVSQDWVGHELTHGYTEKTANLVYQGEPGALNEAWSDIMAMLIENYGGNKDWLIFEDANTLSVAGDAERDMSNPSNGRIPQPDTYKGSNWAPTNGGDNGGVHGNSGVANFWFYLLSEGGNGTNDNGKNYSVSGISLGKAEKIAWKTLEKFMVRHTDFAGARKASLLACEFLGYDKKSNEYKQVCNAWYAVGVGEKCCDMADYELKFKVKDTKCDNSKDGEIELTVKKKNNNHYDSCTYKWYKGDTSSAVLATTRDLFNRDSGRYVVIVKDTVAKCEIVDKTTIKSPEKVKVSISGSGTYFGACQRSFTVVLSASASGGTTPYTFNWANARQEIVMSGGSGFFRIYTATVSDKNGCKGEKSAYVAYIPITCSYDPNDIIGPPSYGDDKWVSINATLPYKIRYENDPKFATGPAQKVTINHKLDSNTDLTSFRLASFGFYKYSFDVPENTTTFTKRLDLRDSFGIYLDVTAGLDISAREAFWVFESIDPATGLPPTSGSKGFLAINDTITHKGEGFVNYTIKAKKTAKTGDSIRAKAIIVFDDNPPVPTPRIFNLIDAKPPTSNIKSLPPIIDSTTVKMTLKGKDDIGGSGLANFDIYVSENGGAYNRVAKGIEDTLVDFRGNYGSSYTAYSIATDNVENREKDKTTPDVSFSIASKDFFKPLPTGTSLCSGDTLKVRWLRSVVGSITLKYSADSGQTFNTIATGLGGTDTLYRWKIPTNISGIKKYIIIAVNDNNLSIIDTSEFFQLKQGPLISLGKDTSFCDGTSFSLTLNPGIGYTAYKWWDNTTTTTKTVTAYGTYSVTVTASTGCKASDEIVITKDILPQVASIIITKPLCFGNTNGSVDITIVSGHAPYTYLWSNAATTQDLSGIGAATYNFTVTDSRGCKTADVANVTQPAKLIRAHTISNVKCFGGNDGSVTTTIAGGTTPYSYAWSNATSGKDINTLIAATYYLEVTDINNCVIRDTAIVTQPTKLDKSLTSVNVLCFGNATGSIDLTVTGGTTAYSYIWTAGSGGIIPTGQSTNQDLTGLVAGTYSVTVTDANNCTTSTSVTITQPAAALSSSKSQVNVKCFGNATGSVTLTVTGGTTSYSYAWTAGSGGVVPTGQSANKDLTGLVAGSYSVTITDANGCTTTNNATITQPLAALTSNKSQINVLCFGNSTGSVSLTVTGGTASYSYLWTAGSGGVIPSGQSTNQNLTGLVAGSYSVTITDANSCTTTNNATISQPSAPLSSNKSQVNVLCFGNATGSITLTVSGGTTSYGYVWTAGSGGVVPTGQTNNQNLTGLIAGTYTVVITDANNCTNTNITTITQPSAPLSSNKSQLDVKCFGNATGSITLTVSGGTTSYGYVWTAGSGGVIPTGQTNNQNLTGLVAGSYSVTITDANGCTTTNNATLSQPSAALTSSKSQVDVKCFGNATGSITITVSGGTTSYGYSWTAGSGGVVPTGQNINQNLTGLVAGSYSVTITDANGCTTTNNATISQPSAALAISKSQVNVLCFGNATGSITLTVSGGTTSYGYVWTAGSGGIIPTGQTNNQNLTGLVAGNYTVTVTDANNCTATNVTTIAQPSATLSSSKSQVDVKCFGNATGTITLTVSGGTTSYGYAWTAGSGGVIPSGQSTNKDLTGLVAGSYSVTITDANGCKTTNSATITQPSAALTSNKSQVDIKCFGNSTGSITLTISGGTPTYTYAWTAGSGGVVPSGQSTNQNLTGLVAGSYSVTITDANGCTNTNNATITQPSAALASSKTQVNVLCFGNSTGSIDLSITGGTAGYTYAWTAGSGGIIPTGQANIQDLSGIVAGSYSVTITDANSCTTTNVTTITQPSAALASSKTQVNVLCNSNSTASIDLTISGGTTAYSYVWTAGSGGIIPSGQSTNQDLTGLVAGTYSVTVTDANGCKINDNVTITEPTKLVISNSVTDVKCFSQNNGGIDVTISGGVSPYTFSWTNSSVSEDLTNVIAGSYTVTATDKNGCTIQTTGVVNQPALLVASHTISNVKCFNGNDGAIDLTIVGGITPYVYSWSSSDITEDISGKITGLYKVTVTDKNLCVVKDSGLINQPLAPLSSTVAITPVNCFNGSDGSVDLSVAGGTTPYTFVWSNTKTTEDISGLTLGTYYVTITDINNCQLLDTALVTQPAAPLATGITKLDVKCFGGNDGSANLTVTGGTSPYNFAWSNSAITEDISNLILGKYVVTITDKNLCKIKDSITINQPAAPLSSIISATAVNCFGGNDGAVNLTIAGGTLNYSYAWSNGATAKDITNLITGKYKVTVTDGNNCILTDSIIVTQPAAPLAVTHVVSNAKCKNSTDGNINLSITGGTTPYTFAWSNAQTAEDAINLGAGHYVVTITDKNGCKLKDSADITEPDSLKISAHGTTALASLANGFVFVDVIGGTLPYSYMWNGSSTNNNDTLRNVPIGRYIIQVVDGNGCTQLDTFNVLEAPPTNVLRIGPNPSNGSLTVFDLETFGLDLPIHFELWDLEGRLRMNFEVIGKSNHTFKLDDSLYNNAYILRIYNIRYEENRKVYLLR